MKRVFSLLIAGLVLVAAVGCKQQPQQDTPEPTAAPAEPAATPEAAAPAEPATPTEALTNEKCPVSGEPVNPQVSTEYNGKKVYFCCEDCVEKFKADPEKYMAVIESGKYPTEGMAGMAGEEKEKAGHEGHEGHEGH